MKKKIHIVVELTTAAAAAAIGQIAIVMVMFCRCSCMAIYYGIHHQLAKLCSHLVPLPSLSPAPARAVHLLSSLAKVLCRTLCTVLWFMLYVYTFKIIALYYWFIL